MKTKSKTRSASNIRTKKTENKKAVLKKPSSPLKSKGKIVKNTPKATSTTKIISSSKKDSSDKAAKEWQITFDAVSDAICLLDKKQRILRTNRAMQEMFDLSPKALIGKFCWKIVHGTTKPVRDCPAIKLMKSLKPEKMEFRVKDKTYNVRAFPVLDDKNALSAIVHIISDITESKKTEETVKDYLNQLRSISEKLADGMVYQINSGKDGSQRIFSYLSPAVERLHGFKVVEAIHHPELIYGQILKEDLDSLIEAETRAFRNKTKLDQDVRTRMPSGEIRWRNFLSVPRQLSNGDVVWDGIEIDITERKQAEDKIAEERKQLNYILDVTKTRIDIIDPDFNLRFVDDSWQKIYGDPAGRKCYEYFMGRKSPCDNCGIPKALDSRQVVITEEVLTREGNRAIEVHTIPFQNKAGEWLVAEFNVDITERKDMEKKLRENEVKYRRIAENMSGIVSEMDANGLFLYNSSSVRAILGYDPEELNGRNAFDFVHPDDHNHVFAQYMEGIQTQTEKEVEQRYRRKDGTYIWVRSTGRPIYGSDGRHIGMIINSIDITDRKKAEENLLVEQELFRMLTEQSSDIIVLIDPSGHIIYENPAVENILGHKLEDRHKKNAFENVHPDDLSYFFDLFNTLIKGETSPINKAEIRIRHADGTWRTFEVVGSTVKKGDAIEMIIANLRDITERMDMEKRLRENEIKFRRITENMSGFVSEMNAEGLFMYNSPSIREILGYEPEELDRRNAFDFVHPEDHDRVLAKYMEGILTETEKEVEQRYRRKDGTYTWLRSTGRPIYSADGKNIGMIVNSIDISERKHVEEDLKRTQLLNEAILETVPGILYLYDDTGHLVHWNKQHAA
ncbi:MAG: PAS domain-containing protein, partial [Smithella sp.]|nr:PAS domain-containing protein [Smithella sp.]